MCNYNLKYPNHGIILIVLTNTIFELLLFEDKLNDVIFSNFGLDIFNCLMKASD